MRSNAIIAVCCVFSIGLSGCAEELGTNAYAMWDVYEHPENLYHFSYLNPPWIFVEESGDGRRQLFAIEPRESRIDYNVEYGNLHARVKAVVEIRNSRNAASAAIGDLMRYRNTARETGNAKTFKSARGFEGLKLSVVFSDRRLIAVYHTLEEGRVVTMKVAGNEILETDDMTLLLKSLEPSTLDGE